MIPPQEKALRDHIDALRAKVNPYLTDPAHMAHLEQVIGPDLWKTRIRLSVRGANLNEASELNEKAGPSYNLLPILLKKHRQYCTDEIEWAKKVLVIAAKLDETAIVDHCFNVISYMDAVLVVDITTLGILEKTLPEQWVETTN